MRRAFITLLLSGALALAALASLAVGPRPAQAQSGTATPTATPTDPNASIAWPPPVYVLRGQTEVRGTANLPNQVSYFVEYRPLLDDLSPDDEADWVPATLPATAPVIDDVLGVWNTAVTEDGLYELRLTINAAGRPATFFVVSPLRIENDPPEFVVLPSNTPGAIVQPLATNTLALITRPTLAATPTAFDSRPSVTANTDSNVRQGDSTLYPVVGQLLTGQSAELLGISAAGSGWYYVLLDNGRRGFIAPSLVSVSGTTTNLPRITPPATPTPTFTPTPPFTGDLLIDGHQLVPAEPRCDEPFEVRVNVTNAGAVRTSSPVIARLEERDIESGTVTAVFERSVPQLNPRENFVATFAYSVNQFPRRDHRITITIDALNQVVEENENNNVYTITYRLRAGACP
jgi:uncharacterized protein YgiM (DUF1202 family)